MFAAGKSGKAVAAGAATDPYFSNTVLLLNDTGTNGAQNNTFIDSSTNNFSITRNGNATQGSVNPYEPTGYWSMYSPGGGSTLTTTAAGIAVGTGDFTCEGWFFFTTIGSVSDELMACSRGIGVGWQTTRRFTNWTLDLNSTSILATATGVVTNNNVWYHLAVTRQSGTIRLFTNGVLNTTVTSNTSNFTSTSFCLGALNSNTDYNLVGNISNFRFVASTALYTSTFTPPTTPLTAVSGTVLLVAQDNRFKDNSSNNFTMTVNGSPAVSGFSPFAPTASYSSATYGGSGYFDGSTDYISNSSSSTAFNFGTGDFTVEYWIYPLALSSITGYAQHAGGATNTSTALSFGEQGGFLYATTSVESNRATSSPLILNEWSYVTWTRSGTTHRVFKNGILLDTFTRSTNVSNSAIGIGATSTGSFKTTSYISNVRVVNGTALYTSNFTPPTAPTTAVTNTSLLLNATNAGIYDATALNDMVTVGNAQVSTAQYKWSPSSMYFDGNADYLVNNGNTNSFAFGTGNFTIEFWMYPTNPALGFAQSIYDQRPTSTSGLYPTIYFDGSGNILYYTNSANRITGSTISANAWYHIALTRSGTSTKLFINGTQSGSTYTDSNNYINSSGRPWIGQFSDSTAPTTTYALTCFNGYIEDLRVTKGIARYTANFTAPTAAFPTR